MTESTCLYRFRAVTLALSAAILLGACGSVHTLENTARLNRAELLALCTDLERRANMDCQWNAAERQSSIEDRQTWEIGCMARRESARDSFDNVCHPSRFGGSKDEPPE